MKWRGVIPAITTPFKADLSVDDAFLAKHAAWLIDHGCRGIVALGSLGEGGTLRMEEKEAVLRTCAAAVGARVPVIAGRGGPEHGGRGRRRTPGGADGLQGLMVLPPYAYSTDWREMKAHVGAVMRATSPLVHAVQQPDRVQD